METRLPLAAYQLHVSETSPEGVSEDHAAHLERSRKKWDRWSDRYGKSEEDFAPMHDAAVDRLDIGPGDSVLEMGCGPGTNLERLVDAVGPTGHVVAVDYSPKMVDNARERASEYDNVDVVRADGSTVTFEPERFDAALASLSMSVMPDARAAAQRIHDAIVPGGNFVVFDLRPIPSGALRVANPLITRFLRWYANWNPDSDVLGAVENAFGTVDVEETYFQGAAYLAVAERSREG